MTIGYSGTPLAKKLGINEGSNVVVRGAGAPEEYQSWLAPLPSDVSFQQRLSKSTNILHLFVDQRAELEKELTQARLKLDSDAIVWVSWPKKSSKVPTDITEDTIRDVALPIGFVDIKVCAVSEIWSGLKLMVRKELR
jgi:Protein of unknown function (DUF3052)